VLVQLFASETRYRTISIISVLGFAVKIFGNVVLAKLYGAQGVLLATGVGAASVLACYVFATRYMLPARS